MPSTLCSICKGKIIHYACPTSSQVVSLLTSFGVGIELLTPLYPNKNLKKITYHELNNIFIHYTIGDFLKILIEKLLSLSMRDGFFGIGIPPLVTLLPFSLTCPR